jgi:hypothetical protein
LAGESRVAVRKSISARTKPGDLTFQGIPQVNGSKVFLKKTADGFLVILHDPWEIFLEGAQELSDDFMSAVRRQRSEQKQSRKG